MSMSDADIMARRSLFRMATVLWRLELISRASWHDLCSGIPSARDRMAERGLYKTESQ